MDDTVKHGITSGPYRNVQHWTTRLKKGYHFYFCKNFGKCRPILIIFALSVSFQEKIYAGFCPTMSHGSRKRGLWPNRGLTSLRLRRMTSSPSQTLRRRLVRTTNDGRRRECSARRLPPSVAALFFTLRNSYGLQHCRPVCSVCSDIRSESRFFAYPTCIRRPLRGVPVVISPSRLAWKN